MKERQLKSIACIGLSDETSFVLNERISTEFKVYNFKTGIEFYTSALTNKNTFSLILSESDLMKSQGIPLKTALNKNGFGNIPFSLIVNEFKPSFSKSVMEQGVAEVFVKPLKPESVVKKLNFLIDNSANNHIANSNEAKLKYKLPLEKRLFDILFASTALLLLSPLFFVIGLLIRFGSKGPVFYYSLRVGTGYKIFRFYKFRSMSADADKKLKDLKHLNQYSSKAEEPEVAAAATHGLCEVCKKEGVPCRFPLYSDKMVWCENSYHAQLSDKSVPAFVKIKDDPRITKVGKFIRNTSIDELPQLWNVLMGDMSIVGNRPLPLYEAEKLTTDKYSLRFAAPAGITGLWQVSKRGKGEMSEDERIGLDNQYAKKFSLLFDIKLLLRTIPALFQTENV